MGHERATDDAASSATVEVGHPDGPLAEPVGSRLGRYRIERVLGEGGMGVVYAAHDPELGRPVAIKLLRRVRGTDRQIARLRREATALAQLSHPNVVAIYETGEHDGRVYLAMELVAGTPLDQWLSAAPRAWSDVVDVMLAAGRGLAAAHDKDLVHRDFKPANVMVGDDGRARVLDFGLARVTGHDSASASAASTTDVGAGDLTSGSAQLAAPLTEAGTVMGTPAYMAPEQFVGDPIDARTDQYAFCVTLFEGLYGRRPFAAPSRAQLRALVLGGELGSRPSAPVPSRLWPILERGLAVRPADRYPDMHALLWALARARRPGRTGWIAAAASVAGLAVLTTAGAAAPDCGEATSATEVWNARRRDDVATAIRGTGVPYAEHTISEVQAGLDAFVSSWDDVHHRTCGTDDPALDRRMQCLARARARAETTIAVLAAADERRVQRAIDAVSRLPDPSACLDDARGPDVPEAVRTEVAAVREALAVAEARSESGDVTRAVATATELVMRARATEYEPVIAEALLARGHRQQDAGDYAAARADCEDAYWTAQRAGADDTAAAAGALLVYLCAQTLGDLDAARTWARHAEGALARIDGDTTGLEGAVRNAIGVMHERAGEMDAALADYVRVAELREAQAGRDDLGRAAALANQANVRLDLGDLEGARRLQTEALGIRERRLGPDHPDVARGLADLASVVAHAGEHRAALELLARARRIDEAALGSGHPHVAMILANIATIYERLGDDDEAAAAYEHALVAMKDAFGEDHVNVALVMHNLGGIRRLQGRIDEALSLLERSHARMVQAWGDGHPQVASSLINLGLAYADAERPDDALRSFWRAREIAEASYGRDHTDVAVATDHAGNTLRGLGRLDEARAAHTEAVEIWARARSPDDPELAIPLTGLGLDLIAAGEPRAAVEPLRRAVRVVSGSEQPPSVLADARFALARALRAAGDDGSEADELGRLAHAGYVEAGVAATRQAAEVTAWLGD